MTYDNWKTTNPADEWLGPDPSEVADEDLACARCCGEGFLTECEVDDTAECSCRGGPSVCLDCRSHRCPDCDGEGQI